MAGKKAKSAPAKAASTKAAKKSAGVTGKKAAGKKPAAKGGTIGSLKKMLGLAAKKPAKAAKKGAKSAMTKAPKAAKPAKVAKTPKVAKTATAKGATKKADEKLLKKGKGRAGAQAKEKAPKTTAPKEAAPPKGKRGRGAAQNKGTAEAEINKSLTTLSLRPEPKAEPTGPSVCREVACELVATTYQYCRMHYIKNWKRIKRKEMILREHKLNNYIEELVSKYPDKYIEAIRQDLANEKDFAKVIADLEIDESLDDFESVETESAEGIIDNLKRDFEDEGDVF